MAYAYFGILIAATVFLYWLYRRGVKTERLKWEKAVAVETARLNAKVADLNNELVHMRKKHNVTLKKIRDRVEIGDTDGALNVIGVRFGGFSKS